MKKYFLRLTSFCLMLMVFVPLSYAGETSDQTIRVTFVNHAQIDIYQKPEIVWRHVKEQLAEGKGFVEQGFVLTPLDDDPAAFLGGYHMIQKKDGQVVDERNAYVTEMDPENYRFSIFADYLPAAFGALKVNAHYRLVPIEGGVRYELDAYSRMSIPKPSGTDAKAQVAKIVQDTTKGADAYLANVMADTKKVTEALTK